MRKPLTFLVLTFACLVSCTSDNDVSEKLWAHQYPQKWSLVEMTGNIPDVPPLTGDDMSWQEYYVFNGDGTFVKSRDQHGVKSEAAGIYDSATYSNQKFLELTFDSGEDLIASCTSQSKETLFLISEAEFISTWAQCDGPGLKYKRLE